MRETELRRERPTLLRWSGYAVLVWSLAYMIPHLVWAVGGSAALWLIHPAAPVSPHWRTINWIATVFLTSAGLVGLAFVYIDRRGALRWPLLAVALIGSSLAASHGLYGIVYRILQVTGSIHIDGSRFDPQTHAYVLWDLLLIEPWFLIEGILLGLVGWVFLDASNSRRRWLLLCVTGGAVGLLTALLGVRFA